MRLTAARTVVVPGEPKAKGRPRFWHGHAYTPATTRHYEDQIRTAYCAKYGSTDPYTGPVAVSVAAYFKIPKNWSRQKTADAEHDYILPTKKPDIDNVCKVIDAINGIAWVDDSQIVMLSGQKYYSTDPRLVITVWPVAGNGKKEQKNEA